jgi:hypothetical protein
MQRQRTVRVVVTVFISVGVDRYVGLVVVRPGRGWRLRIKFCMAEIVIVIVGLTMATPNRTSIT